MECWCTQIFKEEIKNSPFQRTRWRFVGSGLPSAVSGSGVSPPAELVAKVAEVDAEARLVTLVAEAVRAGSTLPFMVFATGVETGVLLGVRGTFFGVVGGDP